MNRPVGRIVGVTALAVAAVWLLLLGVAWGANGSGTVSGVVSLDGQPLAGVAMWMGIDQGTPDADNRSLCTDENGAFEFTDVPFDTPLRSGTGPGAPLGQCANRKFVDLTVVPNQPLMAQYYDHVNLPPLPAFQISADKADLDFDVIRLPNDIPALTASALDALNACYDDHNVDVAIPLATAFRAQVDAAEADAQIDAPTADLMRYYADTLLFVFGACCTGTFSDDDGSIFETDIEWMVAEGITLGCNPEGTLYCPLDSVTRAQMASFLVRALDLPAVAGNRFTDVSGTHTTNINALAEAGVTLGCNPAGTLFCPDDEVTREQMASFLARALDLPPVAGNRFTDVSGSHTANINAIAEAGITLGCNPAGTLYCPRDFVTRGQMAAFLHRALG